MELLAWGRMVCKSTNIRQATGRLDRSDAVWVKFFRPRASSRRRALILDLSENTGTACYAGVGGTRRERADGDVGRDWAGEAADFRAARAARWRTDKAGRPAQR